MLTRARNLILPAMLGAALFALPPAANDAAAWGSGQGGHGGHGGHGGGGHGGGGHGGGGNGGGNGGGAGGDGAGGGGRVGSLIHDCAEGSYQFWCRNKQFKVRNGGGHYHASRKRVRVHYKQHAVAEHYEYAPAQKVVVYEPHVVYEPRVVYEKKVVHKARVIKKRRAYVRPRYHAAPRPYHYEGPVMTTEETVHTDYDGHGVLVYKPVDRRARRKAAHRHGHYATHKRKHYRKRYHKRRKTRSHRRYAAPPVVPAYQGEPHYSYGAHQPRTVYVIKRRRTGPIHRKIPLFGSKKTYRHKVHRKHRRCSPCGYVKY